MKTFLVTQKDKPIVIDGKNYYYKNIISIKDNDVDTLEVCEKFVQSGALSYFNFPTISKKKSNDKPKKNTNKSKVYNNKNKNNKKEEK